MQHIAIGLIMNSTLRYHKYIIGVKPWGQERVPTKVSDNADIMSGWNEYSVVDTVSER
jgi:hypothetical protein